MKLPFSLIFLLLVSTANFVWAQGDIEAGRQKSQTCIACHGVDGNSVNPVWPKIAGQSIQYIKKNLMLFKNKHRINPLMNSQAGVLSEQSIEDLAAYFESQMTSPGSADPALFEQGQAIYRGGVPEMDVPACISCHGPTGTGNPAAGFPKISFQHAAYIAVRLKQYRAQVEHPENPGGEIMHGVSKNLRDQHIDAVASYVQGLH